MSIHRIHPVDLINLKKADTCILDVRTSTEVNAAVLENSSHIPLHELTPERLTADIKEHGKDDSRIYLLCQTGKRAEMAADQLSGHINAKFYIIEGGMNEIQKSHIPVITAGKKSCRSKGKCV